MQNSSIEWTDHTFNPWWGCQRVSPGCEHCYAETLAHRYNFKVWGPAKTTERREMSANYWKQPIKWDKEAAQAGKRARVFCASMADVFEDHPQLEWPRTNLWGLIETTPNLDWLLLTKRPQNILRMMPPLWHGQMPYNVWLGTSCEDQQRADERIPHLLNVPARVRFLSCEPLLGPIDLARAIGADVVDVSSMTLEQFRAARSGQRERQRIDWVIAGGESGHGARPMHPDWARGLRDQCEAAGVAFHFKQWGAWKPIDHMSTDEHEAMYHEIPEDRPMARARCKVATHAIQFDGGAGYQSFGGHCGYLTFNVGKHAAGRLLDGREWNELPA